MGRKKRRRSRGGGPATTGTLTGVEAVDFDIDEGVEPHPHPLAEVSAALVDDAAPAKRSPSSDPSRNVQTLGELLQQARESRGLSIEETSARTRISSLMLRHLESDRFGEFAADTYVKGFLRNYGGFLGVDVGMLLRRYEAISGRLVEREPEMLQVETAAGRPRRRRAHKRAWILTLVALAVGGVIWVFWSRGATQLGLRPTMGLEQIENELRGTAHPPAIVPPATTPPAAAPADSASLPPPAAAAPLPPVKPAAQRQSPSPRDTTTPIEDLVPPGPQ